MTDGEASVRPRARGLAERGGHLLEGASDTRPLFRPLSPSGWMIAVLLLTSEGCGEENLPAASKQLLCR